jgi:hypothetical protein
MELLPIVLGANAFNLVLALILRRWQPSLYCRSLGLALTLVTLPLAFAVFSSLSWRMTLPMVTLGVLLWIYDPLRSVHPHFGQLR